MSNKVLQKIIQQIDQITEEEKLELMTYLSQKTRDTRQKKQSLSEIIGSGKGCFKTSEEADKFISQERDQWEL